MNESAEDADDRASTSDESDDSEDDEDRPRLAHPPLRAFSQGWISSRVRGPLGGVSSSRSFGDW